MTSRLRPRRRRRPLTEAEIKKYIRSMLQPNWGIEVFYRGLDRKLERAIEKLAKRKTDNAGMFLAAGLRDMVFLFPTEAKATAAAKRILAARLPNVRVMMRGFWKP